MTVCHNSSFSFYSSIPFALLFYIDIVVEFQEASYSVLESSNSVEVCLNIIGTLERPVTLTLSAQDGTAISMY